VFHYHGHVCALVVFFEVGGGEGGVALEEEEEGVFGHGGILNAWGGGELKRLEF
jgi:hypothetical protein